MTLKASARTDFSYNCVVFLQSLQICDMFPFVVFLVLPGTCSSRSWSRWCRHTVVSCHSNSHCSTRHLLACWSDWHSLYGMLLDMSHSTLNCHLWGDTRQSSLITQCSHHLSHYDTEWGPECLCRVNTVGLISTWKTSCLCCCACATSFKR